MITWTRAMGFVRAARGGLLPEEIAGSVGAAVIDDAEIERRKPVWAALSELWLDTELEEGDLRRIAGVMKASGYPIGVLRDIYVYEIAPVVFGNLLTVAGEWAGFDHEWLFAEATRRARGRSLMLRAFVKLGIGRRLMTFATERHWETLVGMLGPDTFSSEGCEGGTDRKPGR
jgi:hypothetical protein